MEGTWDGHDSLYTFLDTLDAGEGRLCELVDPGNTLTADLRITSPDIWMISGTDTTTDMRATVNDSVTISFSGLGYTPDSLCRRTDMQTASFVWLPDSLEIGVHRMTVSVPSGIGEPNTEDNSVDFVFQVQPRDYATAVLDELRIYWTYLGIEGDVNPEDFSVSAYPDPSVGSVTIGIPAGFIPSAEILVYDLSGNLVRRFADLETNIIPWDCDDESGNQVLSGLYIVQPSAEIFGRQRISY